MRISPPSAVLAALFVCGCTVTTTPRGSNLDSGQPDPRGDSSAAPDASTDASATPCDGAVEESRSCGSDGRGRETRSCSADGWSAWTPCKESDECEEGHTELRTCGLNARGTQHRSCDAGHYGDWSVCDDDDECADDDSEVGACGLNGTGTRDRACVHGRLTEWSSCVEGTVCVDTSIETRACGFNAHGSQTRTCVQGQFGAWSECDDPDACRDSVSDIEACGINARGTRERLCVSGVWSNWSTCSDDDTCRDADVESRDCGLNDRGAQSQTCSNGTFGDFGACVDPDQCKDGAHDADACGLNGTGTRDRACVNGRLTVWSACVDDSTCVNGLVEERACGFNARGKQARTCAKGRFGDWSQCVDPDVCHDGDGSTEACGLNARGSRNRSCENGAWKAWSTCVDSDKCVDQTTEERACGLNKRGKQARSCKLGAWTGYDSCADPDVCIDQAEQKATCGLNARGAQSRSCVAGQWGAYGSCVDPDVCSDNAEQKATCGLNAHGTKSRFCVAGKWSDYGSCADPDLCRNGAQQTAACGLNGRGTKARSCGAGQWSAYGSCVDPDVCKDGARQAEACGPKLAGTRSRQCATGSFGEWSACSIICGDGVLVTPEECDDKNPAGGDGCSKDCRIERVRWITQIPGNAQDGMPRLAPLHGGRASVFSNTNLSSNAELLSNPPTLTMLESDGRISMRQGFGIQSGQEFSIGWMSASDTDETQVFGYFSGSSEGLGQTSGQRRAFVRSFDRDGFSHAGAFMMHVPSGASPDPAARFFTSGGDFFAAGRFARQESVRLVNASVDYPIGGGFPFYFLRVNPVLDRVTDGSFTIHPPASPSTTPSVLAATADNAHEVLLVRGSADFYSMGNDVFGEGSNSLLLVVDTHGKLLGHYAFPYTVQQARLVVLPNGDTVAEVQFFTDPLPTAQLDDATGTQTLSNKRAVLWFATDGTLLLARSGRLIGTRSDGAVLIRNGFKGELVIEPNTPSARTLKSFASGSAEYVAAYARNGALLTARTIISRTGPEVWSSDAMLVGATDLVLATPCDADTRFDGQGSQQVRPGEGENACLVRVDFEGEVLWATPAVLNPSGNNNIQLMVALDGDRVWTLTDRRYALRYSAQGSLEVRIDLQATVHDFRVRNGFVWALVSVASSGSSPIASADPMGRLIDSAKGAIALIQLRN